jgi:hypothetical protein
VVPFTEDEVGGYPVIAKGTAYADSDHDGMSDLWETRYRFNPLSRLDGPLDRDADGFTNVEEFLNGTIPVANAVRGGEMPPPSGRWTTSGGVRQSNRATETCLGVPAVTNLWDAQFGQSGFSLLTARRYRLTFSARSSVAGTHRMIVGSAAAPWVHDISGDFAVTTSTRAFTYDFTVNRAGNPATLVTFHIGRSAAATLCIDNVSITPR